MHMQKDNNVADIRSCQCHMATKQIARVSYSRDAALSVFPALSAAAARASQQFARPAPLRTPFSTFAGSASVSAAPAACLRRCVHVVTAASEGCASHTGDREHCRLEPTAHSLAHNAASELPPSCVQSAEAHGCPGHFAGQVCGGRRSAGGRRFSAGASWG